MRITPLARPAFGLTLVCGLTAVLTARQAEFSGVNANGPVSATPAAPTPPVNKPAPPRVERFTNPPGGQSWSMTPGTPAQIRYSFVPDGTPVPDLSACGVMAASGPSNLYAVLGDGTGNGRFMSGPGDPTDPNDQGWARIFKLALTDIANYQLRGRATMTMMPVAGDLSSNVVPNGRRWTDLSGLKLDIISAPPPSGTDPFPLSEQDAPPVPLGSSDFDPALSIGHVRIAARPASSPTDTTYAWIVPPGVAGCGAAGPSIGGDIILNSSVFSDPVRVPASQLVTTLERVAAFAFGRAAGLETTCVRSIMATDIGAVMEPFAPIPANPQQPPLDFRTPQLDDRLAIQHLYGDWREPNNSIAEVLALATPCPDPTLYPMDDMLLPGAAVDERNQNINCILSQADSNFVQVRTIDFLSIDSDTDVDYFLINVPRGLTNTVTIRIDIAGDTSQELAFDGDPSVPPIGRNACYRFNTPPAMGPCTTMGGMDIDTRIVRDLMISVEDETGTRVPVNYPCQIAIPGEPTPPAPDLVNCQMPMGPCNLGGGTVENLTFVADTGVNYFIKVEGGPAPSPDNAVQPYYMFVTVSPPTDARGTSVRQVLEDLGVDTFWDRGIRGASVNYLNLEGVWPDQNHAAFGANPPVPPSTEPVPREPISYFRWTGVNANPPISTVLETPGGVTQTSHATAVASLAVGSPFSTFSGVANEARIAAGSVAQVLTSGGSFFASLEALYYNLWGTADPRIYLPAGLLSPVSVINNSWGGIDGDPTGERATDHALDAAAQRLNVAIVCAAGDGGQIDNTATCMGDGGNQPGGIFIGSRAVISPGTAWNVITVGACAADTSRGDDEPPGPGLPVPFMRPGNAVAPLSSRGPIDAYNWMDNITDRNVRSGVHIVAPGTGTLNQPGILAPEVCPFVSYETFSRLTAPALDSLNLGDSEFLEVQEGTSLAAPIVSGTLLLMTDASLRRTPSVSIDPLVLKACLLNAAIKQNGWSNSGNPAQPQDLRDGREITMPDDTDIITPTTNQALDYAQGAGQLHIGRTYEQYLLNPVVFETDPITGDPILIDGNPSFPDGATTDSPITDPNTPMARFIAPPPTDPFPGVPSTLPPIEPPGGLDLTNIDALPPGTIELARRITSVRRQAGDSRIAFLQRPDIELPPRRPGPIPFVPGTGGDPTVPIDAPSVISFPFEPGPLPPRVRTIAGPIFVNLIGWDHAQLGVRNVSMPPPPLTSGNLGWIDYRIGPVFLGDRITATLCWNRNVKVADPVLTSLSNPGVDRLTTLEFEDVELELFQTDLLGDVPAGAMPIASSLSRWSNVEHIFYLVRGSDCVFGTSFVLRVRWDSQVYDAFRNSGRGEIEYAVAWRVDPSYDNPYDDPDLSICRGGMSVETLAGVIGAYNSRLGDARYKRVYDLTNDARINLSDLGYLIQHWRD